MLGELAAEHGLCMKVLRLEGRRAHVRWESMLQPTAATVPRRVRRRRAAGRACATTARGAGAVANPGLAYRGRGCAGRAQCRAFSRGRARVRSLVLARQGQDARRCGRARHGPRRACSKPTRRGWHCSRSMAGSRAEWVALASTGAELPASEAGVQDPEALDVDALAPSGAERSDSMHAATRHEVIR